ncbi:hypothetical protein GCL60_05575 [Silvanigrella paludirubra]|uniref:Uncharacterized protein n=1 Tax=Silvanigrella paludirubra TaxID=2499159 RepID=A0A6N6VY01_9BACT|nr:hypothetical protein [Silvanigrella paludirubra]KAB8039732.1 hypothetical protein GCL60_05575 [Silvanigrella paludirubra]
MPLRSSKLSKWSIYIIISSLILLFLITIFLVIVYFYPIPTITNNFNTAHFSRLLSPWPMSALDQELLERRRLKRYAKGEQLRRMEKQLQRMENLNIPIYDLFLDANAEISNSKYITAPDDVSFLWPILPAKKIFTNLTNPTNSRKSSSVIFPLNHRSQITEGVLLVGGEEIKATIPMVKGRRSFSFNLFLLTPGSIRISLGQYVWAKSFTDDDVQRRIKLSIPINDSTATSIKIISISSSFYLLNANVNHLEHSGRSPIRVSNTSNFWLPNNNYLVSNQKNDNQSTEDDTSADTEDTEEEKILEDVKPEEAKLDEFNANQNSTSNKQQPKKGVEQAQDPLNQIANPQILTNDNYTTAFGYNIVFLQIPKIPDFIMKNKKIFNKTAPAISNLMEQSVVFNKSISISDNASENFRRFIFSDSNFLNSDNISIAKEEINENKNKNTYYQLRKYGYNIVGISYPEAYYFNKNISDSSEFSSIYGKWLERNDWTFANKNLKIDDRNIPVTGLDAIFKTNTKGIAAPLSQKDFPIISNFLASASQNIDRIPDWGLNEYILINNKESYIPRLIDAFQNWTHENQQSRFLAHLLVDTDPHLIRPTIKDLGKSIATLGLSSFLNPLELDDLANLAYIDKAVLQILDTLKARKLENRTIIFALIPIDKGDNKKSYYATGLYKIPGLIPQKNINFENIKINNIVSTILTNVGIPLDNSSQSGNQFSKDIMLEKISLKNYNEEKENRIKIKNNFIKYSMIIKPDENNCAPFLWNSKNEPIFSFQSNLPIYQIISDNQIEFFPCSIKNKNIQLSWYQRGEIKDLPTSNIDDFLGGSFSYKKDSTSLPTFYFGKSLIPSDNISFYFDSMNKPQFEQIFSVEYQNSSKCLKSIRDSFIAIDNFESKNSEDPVLSKKTKIGFFITPL